ncbi:sugar ABC transporter substrate-binding protein [Rhizobium sp. VS19-DR104.2]|uniref:ABC transporter substrate-binding protein n=1 Tax=unclassified Rhizobium TaxID=2613769 RepID=UPI001C5BE940|nr:MULTISPECIES: sugar ABC transporter substrate-binding protein [unclassified Rhizobium]MBZ5762375.1 sugar ABC transporter substrate-binding protein [Rhizobium sp. VS19-DR96]MBZ5769127.1 sugar ABC transporter substrate-binding protein [Rhizobium sp. VS19-DR129.2]MBZ5775955.1 sugar ABC transporter substrate-binding protein [Rhizobium sp. VS19-DRK62.2]MBZ5786281.1 sugar ABC transporter substrate-binding protein [Rhizobium sp. VS19-DR121]MBZ5804275.1 sugar ABC transporter substrate-binding prote
MKRRHLLVLTIALSASAAFPAFAQDAAKPYAGTTLAVLMEGHPTTDGIQALLPEFTKETGIEVNLEIIPESDITAKELLEFSSASGRYDVVQNNIIFIPGFVKAGFIDPLDDLAKKFPKDYDKTDFVPGYLNTNVVDGKLYGLPVYGESTFLMYRKDLFDQYGITPPKTFDDVAAAAKTIKEKSDGKTVGITMRGAQGIQNVYVWAGWLWGYGGEFISKDGKSALGSDEAAKSLDAFANLLRSYGPVGVANFGWEENHTLFQQGKAGMTMDATVNGAFNEDPSVSSVVGKVGYVPVPAQSDKLKGGSSSLAVHSLYVTSASKQKEAAWLFSSWATAKEQQLKSFGIAPNSGVTSQGAMNSEEFNKRYGAFKEAMLASIAKGNPQYLPTVQAANEIINNAGIAVSKVLAGTASAKDALAEANAANDEALAR